MKSGAAIATILVSPALAGTIFGVGMILGLIPSNLVFVSLQANSGILPIVAGIAASVVGTLVWGIQAHQRRALDGAIAVERRSQLEARRRFVHRLNHELKNPLTAMRAGLANLAAGGLDADGSLGTVGEQVDRLSRLVDDLRKLADLETHGMECEPVDVVGLVREVAEMVRAEPGRSCRSAQLHIQEIPWEPGPVRGDRDLLLLAIYNLLDNALKFSPAESPVEIRVVEDGTWTTVEVADAGTGIAAYDIPHVAEELYRGRGAQAVEGSGLGLALVERVASLHDGSLIVRSRSGKGTVATLRLPLHNS
ncbi:MAG TPA: HAMP domain-containing sensor histidine kinase [Chloroflexota bacterium]|nr:HAMP domain-containing sensor histidine kinase [Chloroflexota bacterium]